MPNCGARDYRPGAKNFFDYPAHAPYTHQQAVEKHPSAALCSFFVSAWLSSLDGPGLRAGSFMLL
jgi:hypothetical protein